MGFLAQLKARQDAQGLPGAPLPHNEEIARLQKHLAERQAALWAAMLQRRRGEPAPVVVAREPGDRRFTAPEWVASPYFDYLRQAYLLNADFLRRAAEVVPVPDEAART
ncbi:MAG: class I poly(R)-hydroxyalkanoic acid synthase, partial [Rhodocyclales bacterium]|nr:class I poly(R)-hydroxyalkanoic acid synthase [Rhodocyclales bacterium]